MTTIRAFISIAIAAACVASAGMPGAVADSFDLASNGAETAGSAPKYQFVGTYEHFATPMGSSVSVLMVDGRKIKIVSVDDTRYIQIIVDGAIPEMHIAGLYGVSGEFRKSGTASDEVFIVREIEYFGGGEKLDNSRDHQALNDFFTVDGDARGPLTLSELQVRFPDSLARYFSDEDRECFFREVEIRAADLGDPVSMDPIRRVLLVNSQEQWDEMTNAKKRLQLARYVTSMALHAC